LSISKLGDHVAHNQVFPQRRLHPYLHPLIHGSFCFGSLAGSLILRQFGTGMVFPTMHVPPAIFANPGVVVPPPAFTNPVVVVPNLVFPIPQGVSPTVTFQTITRRGRAGEALSQQLRCQTNPIIQVSHQQLLFQIRT
jgi:hypothetical protein